MHRKAFDVKLIKLRRMRYDKQKHRQKATQKLGSATVRANGIKLSDAKWIKLKRVELRVIQNKVLVDGKSVVRGGGGGGC